MESCGDGNEKREFFYFFLRKEKFSLAGGENISIVAA
jgi:hypothetical protein